MHKFTKLILKTLLLTAGVFFYTSANAGFVHINKAGGTTSGDGLHFIIDDSTQLQVVRNKKGQVFADKSTPDRQWAIDNLGYTDARSVLERLDNGVYLRADRQVYGPKHLAIAPNSTLVNTTALTYSTITAATPATISQGQTQQTTSKFKLPPAGPEVEITWSYIFPYDFITANVKIKIPAGYPVSTTNHVRYFHVIDTYLGGDDNGCGVMYKDPKGKQVIGTYPRISGGCPKSDGLPSGLDTVETFRERDGTFNSWCVGYYEFWGEGGSLTDCNITTAQASNSTAPALNKTVSKVYKDTAMAIEYDFTAPGDYTFSYDFVVGSTAVPAYDHLEVRHPGTSSLCPVNVQVLACLSSAVPCPDNQLIYSGDLTGDLTLVPGIPAVSKSPNQQFSIGSNGPIWTYALQGSSAGVYTFGYSGLNAAPLNGLKCWDTSTNSQSCSFAITNTPCVDKFECMENTLTYKNLTVSPSERNPLYTKVLGKDFDVDVVAVLASGSQSSGYNSTLGLTVDLVVESGNTCGPTVVASQTVPFTSSDNGRKKVTFTASAANMLLGTYPKNASPILRCKVRDLTLNKSGCSSDNFALRPQVMTVSSTDAVQTLPGLTPSETVTPVFRAGSGSFNLTASTGEIGYNGTPKVRAKNPGISYNPLTAHPSAPAIGDLDGNFLAASSGVSSANFKYSEVGHFKFKAQALYDDTFTAVDSAKGDCDNAAASQFNNDPSATPKLFGCSFGTAAESNYFGRFIPDKFKVVPGTAVAACGGFVYYGQDTPSTVTPPSPGAAGLKTPFTLSAINSAGNVTQNYTGSYAKFSLANWDNFKFTASPLNGATLSASDSKPNVTGSWLNGVAAVEAKHKLSRPANRISEQAVTIYTEIQQNEGTVITPVTVVTNPAQAPLNTVNYRFGRLAIIPAHGSELLPLPVQIEAQYWTGGVNGTYIRSVGDSCTTIAPSTIVMKKYKVNLNPCETQISGGPLMSNGVLNMLLSAPKIGTDGKPNTGSVDLEVNLGAKAVPPDDIEKTCIGSVESDATSGVIPWLGGPDPVGRASFGIYKAPIIYMRESFGP